MADIKISQLTTWTPESWDFVPYVDTSEWTTKKYDPIATWAVTSVNSQTWAVVLDADDIDDTSTTNKYATQAELDAIATNSAYVAVWHVPLSQKAAANWVASLDATGKVPTAQMPDYVSSVNGETGAVTLTTWDITEDTDANYVTDAEKTVIGNTSWINTGDQTNITGNAGTVTNWVYTVWDQTIWGVKTFSSFPVSPSSAPTTDYQLANKKYVDDTVNNWGVVWPVSSTDNAIARYDSTTWKIIQNSWVTIDDSNNILWVNNLWVGGILSTTRIDCDELTSVSSNTLTSVSYWMAIWANNTLTSWNSCWMVSNGSTFRNVTWWFLVWKDSDVYGSYGVYVWRNYKIDSGSWYNDAIVVAKWTSITDNTNVVKVALHSDTDQDNTRKASIEIWQSSAPTVTTNKLYNISGALYWNGTDLTSWGWAVDSVNSQTWVVVLDADDIDDTSTTHKFVTSSDLTTLSNTSWTNTGDQTLQQVFDDWQRITIWNWDNQTLSIFNEDTTNNPVTLEIQNSSTTRSLEIYQINAWIDPAIVVANNSTWWATLYLANIWAWSQLNLAKNPSSVTVNEWDIAYNGTQLYFKPSGTQVDLLDKLTSSDIGSSIQAYDANLTQLGNLTPWSNLIQGDGLGGYQTVTPANFITNENILTASNTKTLTNKTFDANGTGNSISNIDVADLANGTDWELITWSSAWTPTTVATGTAWHVLTSNGAWAAPTFQAPSWGGGLTWGDSIQSTSWNGITIQDYWATTQATWLTRWLFIYWIWFNTSSSNYYTWIYLANWDNSWSWYNTWVFIDSRSTKFNDESTTSWAWLCVGQSWAWGTGFHVYWWANVDTNTNWLVNYKLSNTQSWASIMQKIDLWISAQGHTGLLINAKWNTTSQTAISIDTWTWKWNGINIMKQSGTANTTAYIDFQSWWQWSIGYIIKSDTLVHRSNNISHYYLNLTKNVNSSPTSQSNSPFYFAYNINNTAATTTSDNYSVAKFVKDYTINVSWWAETSQWSVVEIVNQYTETLWTVTDSSALLKLTQENSSTGGHILFNSYSWTPTTDWTLWFDGTDLKIRVGGTTYTLTKS